jgi:hypothetical protein
VRTTVAVGGGRYLRRYAVEGAGCARFCASLWRDSVEVVPAGEKVIPARFGAGFVALEARARKVLKSVWNEFSVLCSGK